MLTTGTRLQARLSTPGLQGGHTLLHQGGGTFQVENDSEIQVTFTPIGVPPTELIISHRGITMNGPRVEGHPHPLHQDFPSERRRRFAEVSELPEGIGRINETTAV